MSTIERTTRADWRWPVVFLVLGVLGVLTARQFFFQAFPEASINLVVPRAEIAQRSEEFLRGRGLDPEGFRSVTVFDFADDAKTYLERELGLEEANRVMAEQVNVWRWRTRWVKPPAKEEFSVYLNPAGKLVGFQHQVEENREAPKLEKEEARRIAEVFLRAERGLDLARYELVTDDVKERPRRLDYTFTWEEKGVRIKEATRRMSVTVLGDQVGEFRDFLKIPEQWTRDYERLRSRNALLQTIATVVYVALLVIMVVVLIRRSRQGLPWRGLAAIAAVAAVLFMANFWNEFGLQLRLMPSNFPFEVWTTFYLIAMVGLGIGTFVYVYFLAAAGEPLYREFAPERVQLGKLFTFSGLRSKEFFTSTLIGYGMAGFHIGAVVLFYVLAHKLGSWSPLDIKYSNALSTPMPWLQPMSISVMAATTEEFAFRLFAIPLLLKWTRNKWLAILLPAFAWGFLHSGYPQQPAWIRGFEVGLIGVFAGWVFVRFGILATLVWHYTVDAVLIGLFLLRSEEISYRIAGALVGDVVLLPLVIAGVFLIQARGFERNERILNSAPPEEEAESEAESPAAPVVARPYAGVSPRAVAGLALAGVAGLVILALVQVPRAGKPIRFEVPPARAEEHAEDYLQRRGVKTEEYMRVTSLENGIPGPAAEYLRERKDTRWMAQVYAEQVPSVFWETRFFRPLQKEEYRVFVAPDGEVFRHAHLMDEKTPGPQLDKPEALARATAFLEENRERVRGNPADYRLVEHTLEKREARHDHTLVWESKSPLVGEAHHRITAAVKGGEVTGPLHWIKVPEEWQREHSRPTPLTALPVVLAIVVGIVGVLLFAKAVRTTEVRWKQHMMLGAVAAGIAAIRAINSIPASRAAYETSVPWSTMVVMLIAGQLVALIFVFASATVLAGVAETLLAHRFGRITWWPPAAGRGRAILLAVVAGIGGALLMDGVSTLVSAAVETIPSPVRGLRSGLPAYAPAFLPGLTVALDPLMAGVWQPLLVGVAAGLALRLFRSPLLLGLALLVACAAMAAPMPDGTSFAKTFAVVASGLGLFALFASVVRLNWIAYAAWAVCSSALSEVGGLWRHPGLRPFAIQGVVVLVVTLALVAVVVLARSRREGAAATRPI